MWLNCEKEMCALIVSYLCALVVSPSPLCNGMQTTFSTPDTGPPSHPENKHKTKETISRRHNRRRKCQAAGGGGDAPSNSFKAC